MEESVQQEGKCCSGRDASAEKRTSDRAKWMKIRRAMSRKAAYRFLLREILKAFPVLEKEYGRCRLLTDREPDGSGGESTISPFVKDALGKPYSPTFPGIRKFCLISATVRMAMRLSLYRIQLRHLPSVSTSRHGSLIGIRLHGKSAVSLRAA